MTKGHPSTKTTFAWCQRRSYKIEGFHCTHNSRNLPSGSSKANSIHKLNNIFCSDASAANNDGPCTQDTQGEGDAEADKKNCPEAGDLSVYAHCFRYYNCCSVHFGRSTFCLAFFTQEKCV